ncbi:VRR-NUC domain-containing protein [Anaerosalibacter massiliensis]|uniref:VRR-NUC domain-containing protein n=1 Tax=Anaerosalibacter massiliensis TaxID=1347392 RepID=A0A9X2S6D3_9FIRM|nr:VRR-NUC domain-containing protein [Anaerosalibacter massiliensis]MCR2045510.1 VRR-NUC domain-containing protein [Anaerosalibacter massiliensis]
MREKDIQNEIRLALSPYAIVFRANVGTFVTSDGRVVATGLPKGFSDLFGVRKSDGKAFFIEVKNEKGKTSKYQDNFLKQMKKNNAIVGVARSAEQAIRIIKEEL